MLRMGKSWSRKSAPSARVLDAALSLVRRRIVAAVQGQGISAAETVSGITLSGRGLFARRRHDARLQWPGELP